MPRIASKIGPPFKQNIYVNVALLLLFFFLTLITHIRIVRNEGYAYGAAHIICNCMKMNRLENG